MSRRALLVGLVGALSAGLSAGLTGCGPRVVLTVVDESGAPVAGAWAEGRGGREESDADGEIRLGRLDQPLLLVVGGEGLLSEPVAVHPDDGEVLVPLLARSSPSGGERTVIHFGGDTMLGRRYVTPEEGDALLTPGDDGASARAIVSDLSPAFSLADLSLLNLETVVGTLPDADAYPGKRWLLQTPPEGLAAVQALGVETVGLANNHSRDWLEPGLASTLAALDDAGLGGVGAGLTEAAALQPATLPDTPTTTLLAYTSVDGDYVNDQYPTDDDPLPEDISSEDAWKWEARTWGVPALGVAVAARRIGSAWAEIARVEPSLSAEDTAALWASATETYPELQDWVARRGHGGGARWDDTRSPAAIAEAARQSDRVIVLLHMGFQFAAAPGASVRAAATAAIDAGASLVVAHHPHVLQGVEWYKGRLIVWSLGNLVFDQNFLSTFRSAFLRTVWEPDGALLQARVVPLFLDAYRPVPVAGPFADSLLRQIWSASVMEATAMRGDDAGVRSVPSAWAEGARPTGARWEHGTLVLTPGLPDAEATRIDLPAGTPVWVGDHPLLRAPATAGLEVGRSVFGLGAFDDVDTDADAGDSLGWTWSSPDVTLDGGALQLLRYGGNTERVSARTLARVPLAAHRLYADADGLTPLDGEARYSLRVVGHARGEDGLAAVRVVLYHFDDLDPTEDPTSTVLDTLTLPLPLTRWDDERWIDLPALQPVDGLTPNAALLYLQLDAPTNWKTTLRVDTVDLVEWRSAALEPRTFSAIDYLRSEEERTVKVEVLPWE